MPLDEITSPSLSPHCMRCLLDKFLDACPAEAPWEKRADYLRRILRTVAEGSTDMTAPEINHELGGILRDMFGIERDYTDVKRHFNQLVLGLEDRIARGIEASDDPLGLAIRCALAGNFIDFGPTGDVDEDKLLHLVESAGDMKLDEGALLDLEGCIRQARTITYLMDNCGEIVLDKLLIAQIARENPRAQVTAIVRGAPTSNDATMEDARQVGLASVSRVMGNGSDIAGTCPNRVNEQTLAALQGSDLIISKGLANYETLSGRGQNAFFLFLCKCQLYVDVFGVPLHTAMIVRGV